MNYRSAIITSMVLPVVIFVIGWIIYDSVLERVIPGNAGQVFALNPSEAFEHHLMMSLMMGFLGLMIGVSTLLSGRFSRQIRYGKRWAIFLCIGCVVATISTECIAFNLAFINQYFPDQLRSDWSISMIPLHEIGLYSGLVVLLSGFVYSLFNKNNKANKSQHPTASS